MYNIFAKNNYNPKGIDLEINVHGYHRGKEEVKLKKQTFVVNAALKEGVMSPYYQSGPYYIYMYYKDIKNMYDELYNSDEFLGYTVFTKDYQNLMILQNKLDNLPVGVNKKFIDTDSINKIIENGAMYRNVLITFIITTLTIILLFTQTNYFYKRNKEYTLLKINGLYYWQLAKLTMLEITIKLFISSIFSFILYGLILMISSFINYQLNKFEIVVSLQIYAICIIVMLINLEASLECVGEINEDYKLP